MVHRGWSAWAVVDAEDDVGVEKLDQRGEVAGIDGCEERVYDFTLSGAVQVGGGWLGATNASAGATGELPGGRRASAHQRGDLVKGEIEHVVQYECQPLSRVE